VPFGVHQHAFPPVEEQLDGFAGGPGKQSGVNLTGNVFFSAKSPAGELTADAHAFFRHAQSRSYLTAVRVGNLGTDINFHAAVGQRHSDAAFRLHEQVVSGRRVESVFKDNFRVLEAFLCITFAHFNMFQQVTVGVQLRRIRGKCLLRCGKDRQQL